MKEVRTSTAAEIGQAVDCIEDIQGNCNVTSSRLLRLTLPSDQLRCDISGQLASSLLPGTHPLAPDVVLGDSAVLCRHACFKGVEVAGLQLQRLHCDSAASLLTGRQQISSPSSTSAVTVGGTIASATPGFSL